MPSSSYLPQTSLGRWITSVLFALSFYGLSEEQTLICKDKELLVAWHEYKPFSYVDTATHELVGLDISLLTSILDKLGCKYHFSKMTWGRTLTELKKGTVDISMYAFMVEDRKQFHFSIPYRHESVRMALLSKNIANWEIKKLSDINAHSLAVATDKHTWYGEEFNAYLENPHSNILFHIHGIENRLDMLIKERVDVMIGDPLSILLSATELGLAHKIYIHPYPIYDEPVHFIFSPNSALINENLIDAFNSALNTHLINSNALAPRRPRHSN
jgi:ABC-type amino acid transport substrate-binding protein